MYYLNTNIRKEQARIFIIAGGTLKAAAKETGLSIDQVKKMSAKEHLQEKQRDFLNKFYAEQWERIRTNKLKRIRMNELILESLEEELQQKGTTKEFIERLKETELIEQLIFEVDRIEKAEIQRMKIELQAAKKKKVFSTQ